MGKLLAFGFVIFMGTLALASVGEPVECVAGETYPWYLPLVVISVCLGPALLVWFDKK